MWISFAGILIGIVWVLLVGGDRYFNLDLELVYDFRDLAGEVLDVGVMAYLMSWVPAVFAPALLVLALLRKNIALIIFVLTLHVIWFGVTSHKTALFSPILILFVWFAFRYSRAVSLIPFAFTIMVLIALISAQASDDNFGASLFIRRVFFVPSHLTFSYYEFFSKHEFVFWSNSITSVFIKYPYPLSPPQLISDYLGGSGHANNSFLSTGYMHAGILGIIFYCILVGKLFNIIDGLAANGMSLRCAIALVIVPAHSLLTSADLPTSLLTHGFGIVVLILYLMRFSSIESRDILNVRNFDSDNNPKVWRYGRHVTIF